MRGVASSVTKSRAAMLFVIVLGFTAHAQAALEVTEIMYNPVGSNTGHQWVEVVNNSSDPVDLGDKIIRFFDAKGNHLLKPYGTGSAVVSSGAVAIISQNPLTFLSDYPDFTGTLIKSSFTLTSSGIVGISQTDGTILAKASYTSAMGAAGDGNSLQFPQGASLEAFKSAAPTPGVFPVSLPAKIIPSVKPIATKSSSKKRASRSSTSSNNSKNNYGKGTVAPPASADAEAGGALSSFSFPAIPLPNLPLFSSPWFAAFLALLAFSSFSLILIQRTVYL